MLEFVKIPRWFNFSTSTLCFLIVFSDLFVFDWLDDSRFFWVTGFMAAQYTNSFVALVDWPKWYGIAIELRKMVRN